MDDILDILDVTDDGTFNRGFVLWHGVVEDIYDPLKLGRVRVRIIGWHNLDQTKMPLFTLPWASVVKSTTGAIQSTNLQLGDWVTGFFNDGLNAQRPIVIGKYDGINRSKAEELFRAGYVDDSPRTDPRNYFTFGSGYDIELTDEQKKMLRSIPKPAFNIKTTVPDRPTTPLLAQGLVEGTAVGVANKNRAHVCDISAEMKKAAAITRAALGMLMKGIRAAVKAILGALGISLDSESARFIELAKKIKNGIDYVRRFIDMINDYATIVVYYARQVRAMIDWILSLPKILAEMLAGCLNELLNSAAAGFSSLIASAAGVQGNPLKEVAEIIDSSQKLITSTSTLLNVPSQVVGALSTSSTAESQNQALNTILTFTSSFSTSNNSISNISRP